MTTDEVQKSRTLIAANLRQNPTEFDLLRSYPENGSHMSLSNHLYDHTASKLFKTTKDTFTAVRSPSLQVSRMQKRP
jgi:hypothetical protein